MGLFSFKKIFKSKKFILSSLLLLLVGGSIMDFNALQLISIVITMILILGLAFKNKRKKAFDNEIHKQHSNNDEDLEDESENNHTNKDDENNNNKHLLNVDRNIFQLIDFVRFRLKGESQKIRRGITCLIQLF